MLATQFNDGETTNSCSSSSSIWNNAVQWIKSNGGYVHPQLSYNESERQVYFGMSYHSNSDSHPSTTSSSSSVVDAGTTLLQIPDACLVSLHSAERNEEFGKSLFGVVHSLEASLYHDAQDVVLALFLAQQQHQRQQESFYKPYLATLPCCNNLQLLPRQWSSNTLRRRLHGTSLYQRIIREQNSIKCEYELIKTTWIHHQQKQQTTKSCQSSLSFPTYEQYDNMMALITSRGFDKLGNDGVDVMIPLLDLLNHVRGHDNDSGGVAHVRYERYYHETKNEDDVNEKKNEDDSEEPTTKRIKMNNSSSSNDNGGGGVKVTAGQSIVANGTKLQMTYGAKSNATLLGRYGFCIANNVEPDGSCNDFLEIELKENTLPVKLQRGPKSYTYGMFTKALQLFHDGDDGDNGVLVDDITNNKHLQDESVSNVAKSMCNDDDDREQEVEEMNDEDDGGLQAFLDDCEKDDDEEDEEGDHDEDLDDVMYSHRTSFDDSGQLLDNSHPSASVDAKEMMNELRALEALYSSLKQAMERCEQNSLICSSSDKQQIHTSSEDDYCVILIKSEMQTIKFYMKTASILQSKLSKSSSRVADVLDRKLDISNADQENINDLVNAFLTIRYPGVSI